MFVLCSMACHIFKSIFKNIARKQVKDAVTSFRRLAPPNPASFVAAFARAVATVVG